MAAKDYTFDPGMSNLLNKVANETVPFNPAVTLCVVPINHPFFGDSLVVQGQLANSTWVPLNISKDYVYSPLFIEATASSGKELFSYFVVLNKNIKAVKFSYHTLGLYTDETLLASLAAKTFDRTDAVEWGKIDGNAATYHPMVRDPEVIGRSHSEILNIGLEKLRLAIANPHTGAAISASDVTDIYVQLGLMATKSDLSKVHTFPTKVSYVEQNTQREIYRYLVDYKFCSGEIMFKSKDSEFESVSFKIISHGSQPLLMLYGNVRTEAVSMINIDVARFGTDYRIVATPNRDGDFIVKIHSQFM